MTTNRMGEKTVLFFKILASSNNIDLRLFWKIMLRVENGEIKCEKELALWGKLIEGFSLSTNLGDDELISDDNQLYIEELKNNWHRFLWNTKPLSVYFKGETNGIKIVDNDIEFDGGYLEIIDEGINEDLEVLGFPISQNSPIFDGVSTSVWDGWSDINQDLILRKLAGDYDNYSSVGRNIYLETEYAVEKINEESIENKSSTIFYFCQDIDAECKPESLPPYVELRETMIAGVPENIRAIYWHIVNKGFETKGEFQDVSVSLTGRHLVTVNQDQDMLLEHLQFYSLDNLSTLEKFKFKVLEYLLKSESEKLLSPYFEILVDAIPLQVGQENDADDEQGGIGSFTSGEYKFPDKMTFYVGSKGSGSNNLFRGKLRYLTFDPNSSCDGCAG